MAVAVILIVAFSAPPQSHDGDSGRNSPQLSELKGETFRNRAEVESRINDELKSPRYKRLRTRLKEFDWELNRPDSSSNPGGNAPGWFRRFVRWLFGGGRGNNSAPAGPSSGGTGIAFGGLAGLFWPFVWGLLAVGLLIIIALLIKAAAVRNSDPNRKRIRVDADTEAIAPTTPPGEIPSDEYMHRALQFAEQGDHRRALRQLVLGGMSWIERAGLIRFRRGLTNRDYVRAVYRRVEQRQQFAGIILDFERVFFGRRDATAENFEEALASYRAAFGKAADPAKIAEEQQREREAEAERRRQELHREQNEKPAPTAAPQPTQRRLALPSEAVQATTEETELSDVFDELTGDAANSVVGSVDPEPPTGDQLPPSGPPPRRSDGGQQ